MSASHLDPPKKLSTGHTSMCGMGHWAPAVPVRAWLSLQASEQYQAWLHWPAPQHSHVKKPGKCESEVDVAGLCSANRVGGTWLQRSVCMKFRFNTSTCPSTVSHQTCITRADALMFGTTHI